MGKDEIRGLELWMCTRSPGSGTPLRNGTGLYLYSCCSLPSLSLSSRSLLAANIYQTYEYSSHTIFTFDGARSAAPFISQTDSYQLDPETSSTPPVH